jgi:hypothetical protein
MYYIETKAICCHTQFGQFLGTHQTLGGGGSRYFCGFYLAIINAVLIARTNINKYRIIQNLHFWSETNPQKCIYFNTPLILWPQLLYRPLTDRYSSQETKIWKTLVALVSIKYIIALCEKGNPCWLTGEYVLFLRLFYMRTTRCLSF